MRDHRPSPPRWPSPLALGAALACALLLCASAPARAEERPDLFVLAVGVSTYEDPAIPDLRYADDDVRALASWADTQKAHYYQDVHVKTLTNEEATRSAVIDALLSHFAAARPGDQVVLFLSGHGVVDATTHAWHFLTSDSALGSVAATALEQDDVLKKLDPAGTRQRVLVLVDTCQSGALADSVPRDGKGLAVVGDARPMDQEVAHQKPGAWVIMTAGRSHEKAVEGPEHRLPEEPPDIEGHGLFASAILQAVGGTAADRDQNGLVTLSEFQSYVSAQVRTVSQGQQIPVVSGNQTDIELAWASGTPERCDGLDNNWDGQVDEGFDHNFNQIGDCREQERCNGIDDNSDGQIDEGFDLDGDGYRNRDLCGLPLGDDCDDTRISVHPGQPDWGNLRDDDCDGRIDEEDFDRDLDGVPDAIEARQQRLKATQLFGAGGGLLLAAAGGVLYREMEQMEAPDYDRELPFFLFEDDVARYQAMRTGSAALLGAAGLVLGASVGFSFYVRSFEDHYLQGVQLKVGAAPSASGGLVAAGGAP